MSKDAIGLLIDLARQGEIDPWDIDVVQLTDRFLQSLGKLDASDLPRSGQALFYASVLVSMKAEILEARLQPQPEPEPIDEDYLETQAVARLPLERMLHRRPSAPAMQDRPLTLNDLIAHLKEVEQIERRQVRERPPERRVSLNGISISTMAEVEELAHHENLEAVVTELRALIARLGPQGDAIPFAYLLEHYQDRVGAFLGLLFLAHRSQVTLVQTDFYRDILVYGIQSEDTA